MKGVSTHTVLTCVFCPKLCRFACPVAEAETRETVTPWGLMTRLDDVERGLAGFDSETAELLWHCTGCRRCEQVCKHHNPVFDALVGARRLAQQQGLTPAAVTEWHAEASDSGSAYDALPLGGPTQLLAGRANASTVEAAIQLLEAAGWALGRVTHPPPSADLEAGAPARFPAFAAERVICVEAADAAALKSASVEVLHLSQALAGRVKLRQVLEGDVLYLDQCGLGRGLGLYDGPRALLAQVVGGQLREAFMSREEGGCCGAGAYAALHPEGARQVAIEAAEDHPELPVVIAGGACSEHLRASLTQPVYGWAELLAQGLSLPATEAEKLEPR